MKLFDPWTTTIEEAMAQPNANEPQGSIQKAATAHRITASKESVLQGDGFDVLQAVAACAVAGLEMPDWLAKSFLNRYRAVQQLRVDSWDAEKAFGRPYPKGMQLARKKRQRDNRIKVINAVTQAIQKMPDRAIDTAFWEGIGAAIGEGKTNAQKLHAEAVRLGYTIAPSDRKQRLMSGR
jgi:hypothetical protein